MSALTSLLARDKIVPVRKIEEALSRQVLEGGEIETVLLEMGLVQEDVLSAYRAALYGLIPATREEVMHASRVATRALAAPLAQQLRVLPLSFDGKSLVVAAAEPPSESALRQVGEAARAKVSVRIVNEPRLLAGLSHHYGLELEHRFSRLIDKLRRKDAGTIRYVKPPAGGPIAPVPQDPGAGDAVQVESARAPRPSLAPRGDANAQGTPDNVSYAVAKECRGPLVEQRAQEVLARCETREDVLYVLLRYASQFFEFAAIFSVQRDSVRGRGSRGAGVTAEAIRSVDLPLVPGGLVSRVVRDKRPLVGMLGQSEEERAAIAPLERPPGCPGVAVPLTLGTRVVLVLYADRDGEALGLEDAEPFTKLLPAVGEALRHIIVAQKTLGTARSSLLPASPSMAPAPPPVIVQGPVPAVLDSGSTATDSADGTPRASSGTSSSAFPPHVPTQRLGAPGDKPSVPRAANGGMRSASTAEMPVHTPAAAPADADEAPEREAPVASFDDAAPPIATPGADWVPPMAAVAGHGGTLRGVPRAAPPPPTSDSDIPPSHGPSPSHDLPPAHEAKPSTDVAQDRDEPSGAYSLHSQDGLRSERAGPRSSRPPSPPFSAPAIPRFSSVARPSTSRTREREAEPSIVVEAGTKVSMLISELMQASPEEEPPEIDRLVEAGDAALPELVRAFPGPLWFDRHQPHRRRPSAGEVSAVARALVAFGDRAVPHVAELVRGGSGDVCFFALMVAGELPHGLLVEPVARRMFDPDPGIAQLSIEVLRGFVHLPEFELVLSALRQLSGERERPLRQQFALRALAQLGDARAASVLLAGLRSSAPAVARVAHESLVLLTCRDFGSDVDAWQRWLSEWGDAHRVEWLIEGLLQDDEHLRQLAGAELTRVTHQSFGYHPGLSPREREVAQRKYRDWWEREGRGLFTSR